MNGNGGQRTVLGQKFGRQEPEAWTQEQTPMVVFWLDGELAESIALPYFSVLAARYVPEHNLVSIEWSFGTVIVRGPKALELYRAFSRNRATEIRADAESIESVTFVVPAPAGQDGGGE
jgi:hypothetical protein